MKKLILTGAALVAFAAASFAQNNSTVNQSGNAQTGVSTQNGNQQTANIQQVGTVSGANQNFGNYAGTFQGTAGSPNTSGPNTANINQNGGANGGSQGNRAASTQSGNNQLSTINQNGGANGASGGGTTGAASLGSKAGDGNFAGTLQTGAYGTATVNQNNGSQNNLGEVYQNGSGASAAEQNQGTVNQSNTSSGNTGSVYQGFVAPGTMSSAVKGNQATINQGRTAASDPNYTVGVAAESINNRAAIQQTADGNNGRISQGATGDVDSDGAISAGRSAGSQAQLTQSGANNTGTIDQGVESGNAIGSQATLNQSGTNNKGEIVQAGLNYAVDNGSTATIIQEGTNAGRTIDAGRAADVGAGIYQGFVGTTTGNTASIHQTANSNDSEARIYQAFGGNATSAGDQGTIMQGGLNNFAQIVQSSTPYTGAAATGSGNQGFITQVDGTSENDARMDQGRSEDGTGATATDNVGRINQSGNNSNAAISQGRIYFVDADGNDVQLGAQDASETNLALGNSSVRNDARIDQVGGTAQNANISQSGTDNDATITQTDGSMKRGVIVQTGGSANARATITQNENVTNNNASIYQIGGTDVNGSGIGNDAGITQGGGSFNEAHVRQGAQSGPVSNDNTATMTQNGNYNEARLRQTNSNNMATVMQTGGSSSAITNRLRAATAVEDSFAIQNGIGNTLNVMQTSTTAANNANVSQVGNGNSGTVTQQN
ncbi:beta strand repeat-containing protein [Fibrella forsythiae]|uniref:Curlin associated repeat-containing protein n=1 Tax=Fibrella forsythiae TaxID=2817061 RepID=A0ABS3JF18_9BACT|nr:hypothetical protein [Fibrella forsythiae]MBO0948595.1 hypothetical protein [Fibrella forsythiae]